MRRLVHRYGHLSWLVALAYWLGTPATTIAACCGPTLDPFGATNLSVVAEPHVDAHAPFEGHECRMDHLGLRTTQSRETTSVAITTSIEAEYEVPRPYTGVRVATPALAPSPPPTLTTVRLLL